MGCEKHVMAMSNLYHFQSNKNKAVVSPALGFADHSPVDILGLWYKSVDFGEKKSPGWRAILPGAKAGAGNAQPVPLALLKKPEP